MERSPGSPWIRLRIADRDLDLFEGEHVVGRGAECSVSLDDPVASRVHAVVVVATTGATVQDLGSRNGVFVNGRRIQGAQALNEGDIISVGSSSIGVRRVGGWPSIPPSPRGPVVIREGNQVASAHRVATTLSFSSPGSKHRIEAYRILAEAAKKHIVSGRAAEAEAILERPLAEVLATLRSSIPIEHELVTFAALHAIQLARAMRKPYWIDFVFDLYAAFGAIMPAHILDRLDEALEDVSDIDRTAVRVYVTALQRAAPANPSELPLRDRVEALARRIETARK